MLEEYLKKRHFERTPEPSPRPAPGSGSLVFVIQKHAARRLHYDLRLEVDGVLKSWAIPSGPSLDPKVKRLAVMVEDHPLEYQSFEGIIPKGEYGAGQVIVWDKGVYLPDEEGHPFSGDRARAQELVQQGLQKGKISLFLYGNKLEGSWALVKMQRTQNDWLLIKHQDEFANPEIDVEKKDASVMSGLTIQDLKEGHSPKSADFPDLGEMPGAQLSPFPAVIRPMLASLAKKPFSNPLWIFEPKLDGYRIMAFVQNGEVKLVSRNGLNVSQRYPNLVQDLKKLKAAGIILDGELVAWDERGRLCFQCLQDYGNRRKPENGSSAAKYATIYYVFDILYLNGYDLRNVPLQKRKELLNKVWPNFERVRLIDYFENDGIALFEASLKMGLEGVIAKLRDSVYESGRRSQSWLKIKSTQSDEFVIGGYTLGAGNRADTFGALLLGIYNNEGQLVFAGHVGSGFDDIALAELRRRLKAIETEKCPFMAVPPSNGPVTWVKPELVAEVKFAERTQEGYLRAPVFLHLREDKSPVEVLLNEDSPTLSVENPREDFPPPQSGNLTKVLEQLRNQRNNFEIEIERQKLSLSNLDKAIWPAVGSGAAVTKRDLLLYLTEVSPYLLPHLKDRPLTLTRYPNGIQGEHFYQKHSADALPPFVKTFALSESESGSQDYLVCNNLATLLWLGQLANVDIHTWFSRVTPGPIPSSSGKSIDETPEFFSHYPDFIVFDIDPYIYSGNEPAGAEPELNRYAFEHTGKVALWLKDILDSLSLNSFLKTSGKTGLHIYVPLIRQFDFHEVHAAAKTIASFLLQNHPQDITIEWSVASRTGKVFLDYNQNVRGKTLASIYSPRPTPQATVSAPLLWAEISTAYPTDFTILNMPGRLAKKGDLWIDILNKRSDLGKVIALGD
jgi:bifunctional non-homologous end joining protein LigD